MSFLFSFLRKSFAITLILLSFFTAISVFDNVSVFAEDAAAIINNNEQELVKNFSGNVGCETKSGFDGVLCDVKLWLGDILMGFMYLVLGAIAWIVQFVGQFIFTALAYVTNYALNINPADDTWLPIFQAPFAAMVSIANIFILASFVYAGVSRIINFTGKMQKVQLGDFFEKIVLTAILINFSFYLVAGFISLMYEIGQFFLAATTAGLDTKMNELKNTFNLDLKGSGSNIFVYYVDIISGVTQGIANDQATIDEIEKATGAGIGFFAKNLALAIVYFFGLGVMWRMLKLLVTRVIIL